MKTNHTRKPSKKNQGTKTPKTTIYRQQQFQNPVGTMFQYPVGGESQNAVDTKFQYQVGNFSKTTAGGARNAKHF